MLYNSNVFENNFRRAPLAKVNTKSLKTIFKLRQDKPIFCLALNGEKLNALSPPEMLCKSNIFETAENIFRGTPLGDSFEHMKACVFQNKINSDFLDEHLSRKKILNAYKEFFLPCKNVRSSPLEVFFKKEVHHSNSFEITLPYGCSPVTLLRISRKCFS